MYHTLTAISGGNRWFLFGGRSSPTRPINCSHILTLNGEFSSDGCQNSSVGAIHTLELLQDSDLTGKDIVPVVPDVKTGVQGKVDFIKGKKGTELKKHQYGVQTHNSVGDCGLENSRTETVESFDTTSECDDFSTIDSGGVVDLVQRLQVACLDSTPVTALNCYSDEPDKPPIFSVSKADGEVAAVSSDTRVAVSSSEPYSRSKKLSMDADINSVEDHNLMELQTRTHSSNC